MDTLVPITPELYENEEGIGIVPFTINPLKDIMERAPTALESCELLPTTMIFTAYRIYWPVCIAQYTGKNENPSSTLLIPAYKDNPPIYQWSSTRTAIHQWINN